MIQGGLSFSEIINIRAVWDNFSAQKSGASLPALFRLHSARTSSCSRFSHRPEHREGSGLNHNGFEVELSFALFQYCHVLICFCSGARKSLVFVYSLSLIIPGMGSDTSTN